MTCVDFSDRLAPNGQRALLDVGVKLACVSAAFAPYQCFFFFFSGIHGAKIVVFLENLEAMLGEYGLISNFEGSGSLGEKPMVTWTDLTDLNRRSLV